MTSHDPDALHAWHFVSDTLRDGRPIPPDGEWLRHEGKIKPCASGLHASIRLIDALQYAPGNTLCRVIVRRDIQHHDNDKIVGSERLILWRYDAEATLRQFARKTALSVAHLWDMPDIVRQYLETGDESIRAAARGAARAAACDAACDAAWDAARDAARGAAWAAAWAAVLSKFNDELEAMVREAAGRPTDV